MMDSFQSLIDQVDVLSLDVFDTILGRLTLNPNDVFAIVESKAIEAHGEILEGFAKERIQIDSLARRKAWDERQTEEISLNDIYQCLGEKKSDWKPYLSQIEQLELSIEKSLLYPLDMARKFIQMARVKGKRVIFVSDMYLPKDFCEDCLHQHGFKDYDHFYLSSEIGLLKHTGNLFDHIITSLEIEPHKILHVGDNSHSDQIMAENRGLKSCLVPKASTVIETHPYLDVIKSSPHNSSDPIIKSIKLGISACGMLKEQSLEDPLPYRIGYQIAGPLMVGYIQFIIDKLEGRNLDHIYFLSRDGFILKKIYDNLTKHNPNLPKSKYIQASRRSLNFCSITELDQKTEDWLVEGIHLTVNQFLQRINLDPNQLEEEIKSVGFKNGNQIVREAEDYLNIRTLFRKIEPLILKFSEEERENYLNYLKSEKLFDQSTVVLVDVGWRTSIQHSLFKLLKLEKAHPDIEGFYLGSYSDAYHRKNPNSRHHHYLMAYGNPKIAFETIRSCVGIIEFFFAAPDHTFIKIDTLDNKLVSVFATLHENEKDLPFLSEIHRGVLDFEHQINQINPLIPLRIHSGEALLLLKKILETPTKEEAKRLGEIHYADGYGAFFHHTYMARPSGFKKLFFNKSAWKSEFKSSHWPTGYYKRLNRFERFLLRKFHPNADFVKRAH